MTNSVPIASAESIALAEMAVDDARKTLLGGGPSGRVRLDAISAVRSCGRSLREASVAVDYVMSRDTDLR